VYVHGFWPIFFLMVILKVPVGMLLYLVWWAFRAEPLPEEAPPESEDHRFGRFRREPKRPRGPRRGGHGPDAIPIPATPHGGRSRVISRPATVRAARTHGVERGSAEPLSD
jgi:hypothetical protein